MTATSEKHTQGEITFSSVDHAPVLHLYAEDNKHLFHGSRSLEEQQANAARIVLTWNCHDELVEACRGVVEAMDGRVHSRAALAAIEACRAALSRATSPTA